MKNPLVQFQKKRILSQVEHSSLPNILPRISTAWLVSIIALLATVWSGLIVKTMEQQQIKSNIFDFRVERIRSAIINRMKAYQQMLEGGAALFESSAVPIKRREWNQYVSRLHLKKYYPGIQGVGFSQVIHPQDKAAHLAEIRAEGGLFLNYALKPEGERELYTSIVYLEPLDQRNQRAIGYDMFSEPIRRAAMEQARDTGEAVLSGKVTLIQETNKNIQVGCLMYVPVYRHGQPHDTVAEKRAALIGYVYSPFRMQDLMQGIFGGNQQSGIDFHIYDGESSMPFHFDQLMYDEALDHHHHNDRLDYVPQFTKTEWLPVAQRVWTVHFATLHDFNVITKTYMPEVVWLGGVVISFLLFGVTRSLEMRRILFAQQQINTMLQDEVRERTHIAQALQESQKQLRLITDHIPAFIAYVDAHQVYRFVNKHYEEWFGVSRHQIIGKQVKQILGEDIYTKSVQAPIKKVLSGQPTTFEMILSHPNGPQHWVHVQFFPDIDLEGAVIGYFSLTVDISERKRTEETIREQHARLLAILENTEDIICLWNREERLVFHNTAFAKTVKKFLNVEACAGLKNLDYLSQDQTFWKPILKRVIDGEHYQGEFTRKFEGEETRYYEISYHPIRKDEEIIGYSEYTRDITERKKMEELLRANEYLLSRAVRITHLGTFKWNLVDNSNVWSEEFFQIFGIPNTVHPSLELFSRALHPEDYDKVTQALQVARTGIRPYEVEYRIMLPNGELRYIQSQGEVQYDELGQARCLIGTVLNITERKQMELKLQYAKETADAANRAKSIFLANMSHELRTPLNAILGYAQILSGQDSLTEEQKSDVTVIRQSGEYLLTLINDVLDLAKIEAGKIELFPTVVFLNGFLQEVVQLFHVRTQQKKLIFSYQTLSTLPAALHADEKRLRQVLINLLGNAVKFTEHGCVTLKTSYGEGKLYLQIEDTGVGIASADLEKIFLPFQQVGHSKLRQQGTGLGLSITKNLVEMMGGQLQVTSILGRGSTFWVSLQLPEALEVFPSPYDISLQKVIGYQGHPRTILIIDDNELNRSLLKKMLTPLGFIVLEAENGQAGLDQALSNPSIDVMFIDLVMPDMDGFTVIQQVRQMPHHQETVLITVSASAFDADRQRSLSLGSNDFIPKPISLALLLECLSVHLKLIWCYEPTTNRMLSSTEEASFQSVPSFELTAFQAAELHELSICGDVVGISDYVKQLETTHEQLANFSRYVLKLLQRFDTDKIAELVEPFLDQK